MLLLHLSRLSMSSHYCGVKGIDGDPKGDMDEENNHSVAGIREQIEELDEEHGVYTPAHP